MRFGLALLIGLLGACFATPALAAPPPPGIVAMYSFDEGSGGSVFDASGNGHAGVISGASWTTAGRYGGALSFDGNDDSVLLGSLGSFPQTGFTLEAWILKAGAKKDAAILGSWTGSGPMLWIDHLAGNHRLTLAGDLSSYLDSGQSPDPGSWHHHAATFDGSTARYYIDGTEVANRPSSSPGQSDTWRIGAYGTSPSGFFDGLIDDIRIYNRPLTEAEIDADLALPVTIANAEIPTAPADAAVAARTKTSLTLAWSPSTDDVGVTGYRLLLDGDEVTTTSATSHTFAGLVCSTSYELAVEALDGDGNASARVALDESTSLCEGAVGLVAAYRFDEGSGGSVFDASGNGHAGVISGASWTTAGRYGGALSFDGNDDSVLLGSLGSFPQTGFTLEAWILKAGAKKDAAILGSWTGSGPMLWIDHLAGNHRLTLAGDLSSYLDSGQSPDPGSWHHHAATFDGSTARYYIDGTEVANRPSSSPGQSDTWRIGAYGTSPSGFFDGLIDDIRIYNRPLGAAEIQVDLGQPPPPPDTTPPSAPGSLTATGAVERTSLGWSAASDDVHVLHYNVHRGTTAGFTPDASNRVAQVAATSYEDAPVAPGTYVYKVTAEDRAGNVGAASNEAVAVVAADTTPPTVSLTAPASGAVLAGELTVTASAGDDQAVAAVQFRLDGQNLGAEDATAPYALAWDTRAELDGAHELTAVARDTGGNITVSTPVPVTISNPPAPSVGLRAAYGLDDGSGTIVRDSSEAHQTGTLAGASWTAAGRFGGGAPFDGVSGRIDLPALGTFYRTGFTYEAWVLKQGTKKDVGIVGTWVSSLGGGAMLWIDHSAGRYRLTLGGNPANYLDSGHTPALGQWQHVAATYDGATARIYVDGVQAASMPFGGDAGNSNTWRIGAYGSPATGVLDGAVDNVRIYDRALSAAEIAANRAARIQPDANAPVVHSHVPAAGATAVSVGDSITVRFDEPLDAATVTTAAFELVELPATPVPVALAYDAATNTATLRLLGALEFGRTYRVVAKAGGVHDLAGNALAGDATWDFATQTSAPPLLLATAPSNPFGAYLGEILRNEGLNDFTAIDAALITPALLANFDVVLLGETPVTGAQAANLAAWVEGGGNLISMRPDPQLHGLLGLAAAGGTLENAYLSVDPAGPGAGVVDDEMQFHGLADRYAATGATAVATLYSDLAEPTANPAVTLRQVGSNGGEAAAFAYDLARSVVYTRQGNPAWATQERDGASGLRPSDMFYGGAAAGPNKDWLDTTRIAIPQADEQQRLLVNLITRMTADRKPLPRFWYLPRGEKAVVVMSGDDHSTTQAPGGTASHFDRYLEQSPAGCSVPDWECVRSSSYVYTSAKLTDAEAAAYRAQGFEIALHPIVQSCPTGTISEAQLAAIFAPQFAAFAAKYASQPAPVSSRTHCVYWPDWVSAAKVERARGIRMDSNYYHYPGNWIGASPGFMTGSGFPMRFADLDGSTLDIYQQHTHLTDESNASIETSIDALLDRALGPEGYYGAFGANMHTDDAPHQGAEAIVEDALARGVPVISYAQLLTWVDGRNASAMRDIAWAGGTLSFTVEAAAGSNGLRALLPFDGPSGTLAALSRGGSPVPYTVETVKGIDYAVFAATSGAYAATYS